MSQFNASDYDKVVDFEKGIQIAKLYLTKSGHLMGNMGNKVKVQVQKSKFQDNGKDVWIVTLFPIQWKKKETQQEFQQEEKYYPQYDSDQYPSDPF